jgi:dTDP-4-amino-4,6-dideoxygalactose transaminase
MKIPFLSFEETNRQVRDEIIADFKRFFDSQWYILGNELLQFEQSYAVFSQTKYCLGISNGLDALHLSLKALNIGEGDEVIVPSNVFIATPLAVSHSGAKPVFAEPRPETFNINPDILEALITPRTKAIIPVHLYGQACEMDKILAIAQKYQLDIIEDNAQAQGATFNNQPTGSFGSVNAVSFYPIKNLGALGDAGAITTNSDMLYEKIKALRNYGSQQKYYNQYIGYNNRLDEIQAAFLKTKLKYLTKWNHERQAIARLYNENLRNIGDLILPEIAASATSVCHLYVIKTNYRDALQSFLSQNGIDTLIHYPVPPHLQEAYKDLGFKRGDFPIAETLSETCISLPLYIGLKEEEIMFVANTIKAFFEKYNY